MNTSVDCSNNMVLLRFVHHMHKMCAGTGIVRLNVLLASWKYVKYRDLYRLELNFALNLVYQTD